MSVAIDDLSSTPVLLTEIDSHIAWLTLNRPAEFNALSAELLAALQAALDEIAEYAEVHVVIIKANGKAFCAGHDLKEMRSTRQRAFHQQLFEQCSRVMQTINTLPQPVIAMIHGVATAAGCQLVAACDLAVASATARFAVSGINLGLFCATPAVPLSRNIHRKQALKMLLTGEFIDAGTAREFGLINEVVAADSLPGAVQQLADRILAKSPLSLRMGKALFYRQLDMDLAAAYADASTTMSCNMDSEDAREGIDAFLEKRQPDWCGR